MADAVARVDGGTDANHEVGIESLGRGLGAADENVDKPIFTNMGLKERRLRALPETWPFGRAVDGKASDRG